ncbi:MAG: adaptor protein MecA [Lachnospiraceae bacterium]|jgi:adapter protein MecA 1/2|nr:adaptor protein MecA [Lachnospiraceae bacterium]
MKIERINENQIRCTLSSFDLSVRNLNLGELAYGSEKARNLFREMIQKASNEVGFDAEDIPLMVEAIPLSNESVMLVITKIEDPEELDTRFSKFSQMAEDDSDNMFGSISNELLEGADGLMELLKQNILGLSDSDGMSAPASPQPEDTSQAASIQTRIYRFDNLDQVSAAAKVVGHVYQGANTLYKKPGSSQYYLVLSSIDTDPLIFSRVCNILAEYGEKIRQQTATEAYYQEHYEVIVYQQALQKLLLV